MLAIISAIFFGFSWLYQSTASQVLGVEYLGLVFWILQYVGSGFLIAHMVKRHDIGGLVFACMVMIVVVLKINIFI